MTQREKEEIQYLLTQRLEGGLNKEESRLFDLLQNEQDDEDWVEIIEELIASEAEQERYDRDKWNDVAEQILTTGKGKNVGDKVLKISFRKRWMLAASVAATLIVVLAAWLLVGAENKSLVETQYAQQKKIALPDETEIILNSKSKIRYFKHLEEGQPREVWLEGEALFKVKHLNVDLNAIKEEHRFIVHTDLANIEVLGTVFNVRERRGKTEVVLEQGKIKVSFIKSAQPDIIMHPGQIVTLTAATKKANVNPIKSEDYTAWTQKKLVLTDASFQQIVEYMEDNFGKRIILTDSELANRKVEGTFKMDNMDDALLVLSKALNVNITQKGDTLIFTPQ